MGSSDTEQLVVSFIVPVCNQSDGLGDISSRISAVAERLVGPYEIIFVDDGSTDGTYEVLCDLHQADRRVKVVELSRSFGRRAAVAAGRDYATGKAVMSLDADCQEPTDLISQMVTLWREGFEIVYSVRKGARRLRCPLRRLACWLSCIPSGADAVDRADFCLMDRKAADALRAAGKHAGAEGLCRWIGFRQTSIPYTPQGQAKSTHAPKPATAFSSAGIPNRPLRFVSLVGLVLLLAAIIYSAGVAAAWPFGLVAEPWVHLFMGIVGLFGLQFLFIALLGRYVGQLFRQIRLVPLYVVRRTLGFRQAPAAEQSLPAHTAEGRNGINIFT